MNTALEFGFRHCIRNRGDAGDSLVLKPLNVSSGKLVFRSLEDKKDERVRSRQTQGNAVVMRVCTQAFFFSS